MAGLRQAGRAWSTLFATFLVSWGFVRSTIDVCLFTYSANANLLWVLIWVDDAIIIDNFSVYQNINMVVVTST